MCPPVGNAHPIDPNKKSPHGLDIQSGARDRAPIVCTSNIPVLNTCTVKI